MFHLCVLCVCRRWGHFEMMDHLLATKPPVRRNSQEHTAADLICGQWPQQQHDESHDEVPEADGDAVVDTCRPQRGSWMALLRNKKKSQMEGIAQIVRIDHAARVIQVSGVGHAGARGS